MAEENQASVEYPGIDQVFSAYYALSHGISPGVIIIEMAPQEKAPMAQGDVIFKMDNEEVLTLTDCRIDSASFQFDESGLIWKVNLLDRRWRWAFPVITKRANIRNASGIITEDSYADPLDLATECLELLGEDDYELQGLEDIAEVTFPTIDWDHVPAASALAELCELMGCRVVLGSDNKVHICTQGKGDFLPQSEDILSYSATPDPLETPDNLIIVGAPIRVQVDLKLIAVGRDVDGSIRYLDDLSYAPVPGAKPLAGWDEMSGLPFDYNVNPQATVRANQFAEESVFRWYKLDAPEGADSIEALTSKLATQLEYFMNIGLETNDKNWRKFEIKDVRQIILTNEQVDQALTAFTNPNLNEGDLFDLVNRDAIVYGKWFHEKFFGNGTSGNSTKTFKYISKENGVEVDLAKQFATQEKADDQELMLKFDSAASAMIVQSGFHIDQEQRMIIFTEPVVARNEDKDTAGPAELCLRCAFYVRDPDTRQPIRYAEKIPVPAVAKQNNLGEPSSDSKDPIVNRYIVCNEISYTVKAYRDASGTIGDFVTNYQSSPDGLQSSQVKDQTDARKTAIMDQYLNVQTPEIATYAGLKQIGLDGAIALVIWSVNAEGSTTTAHRLNDLHPFHLSYDEKRFMEKTKRGFLDTDQALTKIRSINAQAIFGNRRRGGA